jgi:RHS repeat-associated protein
VEDKATSDSYTTPYKFTGKELDAETGLYYFGARYYDARVGRWVSADPALEKYIPKPNDYDTEHDFYWYLQQDGSKKLAGLGGVFNAVNMDVYHYAGNNPVKLVDPDGSMAFFWHFILTFSEAQKAGVGFWDSLKMAWHAMAWDFGGTQSTTDEKMVNSHAMIRQKITNEAGETVRPQQTIEEAAKGTEKFIQEKIKEGTIRSTGEATHAVDKPAESHKEQVWTGELTWDHVKKDIFPSKESREEARKIIRKVLIYAIKINPAHIDKK